MTDKKVEQIAIAFRHLVETKIWKAKCSEWRFSSAKDMWRNEAKKILKRWDYKEGE